MSDDRRFPPTPKRRSDARAQGQVASSSELGGAGSLLIGVLVLQAGALVALARFGDILGESLDRAATRSLDLSTATTYLALVGAETLVLLVPALLILAITGVAISLAQIGPLFAIRAIRPKLERLNPFARFGRLVTGTQLTGTVLGLLKPIVLGALLIRLLLEYAGVIADLARMPTEAGVGVIGDLGRDLLSQCGLALLMFALADFGLRYRRHEESLKMTRREVDDERKQQEPAGGHRIGRRGNESVSQTDPIIVASGLSETR